MKNKIIELLMKYGYFVTRRTETRYIGLPKNTQHVFLIVASYNLKRIPNLIKASR